MGQGAMMLTFGTLGPEGSNHDWVAKRYLAFHRLQHAHIELFTDFDEAFASLFNGRIHHVIQVAVHPSVPSTVAKYRGRAHLIDTLISPSQPMAVLTRVEIDTPSTLGLQMATRDYVDASRWQTLVPRRPGALRPATSPWRAARGTPAEVAGLSNGGAGHKRAFGMPIH